MKRKFWATAKHYWQIHLSVMLCTAVATGVLAGALIVGDSMRGSLRNITLERLGSIQHALIADHFFKPDIVNKQNMVPAILLNGTVVAADTESRASKVNIYGVDNTFFDFWNVQDQDAPDLNKSSNKPFADIIINEALQIELNVKVGDAILVNFPNVAEIHPEFLLGTRDADDVIQSLRVIVSDIILTKNAGRFSLQPHQSLPQNAYIAISVLQKVLGQSGKVNAIFTADDDPISADDITLTLDALGLNINVHKNNFDLQSKQYLLEPTFSETALAVTSENEIPTLPTMAYLANTISVEDSSQNESTNKLRTIPYSTILAVPMETGEFADLLSRHISESDSIKNAQAVEQGRIPPLTERHVVSTSISTDIILNRWAAEDLGVKIGDNIKITYFSVNAEEEYITEKAQFLLKAIVPIEGTAADTDLIPEFPGIHDATNLSEWKPTFPFDYSRVRSKDDAYWDKYKATPKAFIALDTGKLLWKNRFGNLTNIRVGTAPGMDIDATESLFETEFLRKITPEQIGFQFLSLRSAGLKSAKGSTDFGMLFSCLSFFIIFAAATLVGATFAIGVTQRSREIGILQAVGYRLAKIRRRFLFEGVLIATIGSILGCLLAIGYAQLMIIGLKTWWLPAIGTPFIDLHLSGWSLLIGILVTLVVAMYFIRRVVKKLGKAPTTALLAGETDFDETSRKPKPHSAKLSVNRSVSLFLGFLFGIFAGYFSFKDGWGGFFYSIILLAIVFFILRSKLGSFLMDRLGPTQASHQSNTQNKLHFIGWAIALGFGIGTIAGFFGTMLIISLDGTRIYESVETVIKHPITRLLGSALAILGIGWFIFDKWLASQRMPKRLSRLRFGLKNAAWQPMHSQSSVIIMSFACCIIVAVGVNRHDALPETEYAFVAESSLPIHNSLNTSEGRIELGFDDEDSLLLAKSEIYPFRVLPGEDVSCLNLYQPQKPQILGAPYSMRNEEPWHTLFLEHGQERRLPAIGDDKSLRWILHHDPKDDFLTQDEFGNSILLELETVENSLFQSQLIISESDFKKYYPSQSGYQFFLIKTPPELQSDTQQTLEKTLEDYGFDVTSASERLASFRAVENTYISTFQSLGGLGVLLGTFGLALVLFRNIIERRGELATLRAFGFRRQLLFRMLFLEGCFLLTIGMLIGIVAGIVAILGSQGQLPSFPWVSLTSTLILILVFGIIANSVAVTVALRSPLLSTMKSD